MQSIIHDLQFTISNDISESEEYIELFPSSMRF